MRASDWKAVLEAVTSAALDHLESLPDRPVFRQADPDEIRALVGGPLPEEGTPAADVVADLARDLQPYVTGFASGRFFGFVIGGIHPAAYGADLLATTWDQNAGLFAIAPGVTIAEEVAGRWLLDLLDLPRESSLGFVTGGQMANYTCLAAARHAVLRDAGWDVEADGLTGAPPVTVVVKPGTHDTVGRALRFLGFGTRCAVVVPADGDARMDLGELARTLDRTSGPTIVCLDAANINTGCFDSFGAVADLADQHRARGNPTWVHADGAIGLWARASRARRHVADGCERMDSWSTDAHKLLNVPFDSGIAVCREREAHRAAMSVHSSYLVHAEPGGARDPLDWNPEHSRRARGVAVYAALRSLGRSGVEEIVDRTWALAHRFAERLAASGLAEVVNEIEFNQVLVRWLPPGGGDDPAAGDAFSDRVIARVQAEGDTYFGGTTMGGRRYMRISVSDWATDSSDVDRAVEALLRAAREG